MNNSGTPSGLKRTHNLQKGRCSGRCHPPVLQKGRWGRCPRRLLGTVARAARPHRAHLTESVSRLLVSRVYMPFFGYGRPLTIKSHWANGPPSRLAEFLKTSPGHHANSLSKISVHSPALCLRREPPLDDSPTYKLWLAATVQVP